MTDREKDGAKTELTTVQQAKRLFRENRFAKAAFFYVVLVNVLNLIFGNTILATLIGFSLANKYLLFALLSLFVILPGLPGMFINAILFDPKPMEFP